MGLLSELRQILPMHGNMNKQKQHSLAEQERQTVDPLSDDACPFDVASLF